MFSTTIIVCAFIPLFSMSGPEGALFGPMANTYAFAICGALLLAVTLAPVLCSFLFANKSVATDTWLDKIMKIRYLRMLSWVLRNRGITLAVMGSLFCLDGILDSPPGGDLHAATRGRLPLDPRGRAADDIARVCGHSCAAAPRRDRFDTGGE